MGIDSSVLLEHALAGGVAAGLGYALYAWSKEFPETFGWTPNPISTTITSAVVVNVALLYFRKRKPAEVKQPDDAPLNDLRKPRMSGKGPHWLIDCTQEAKIHYSEKGLMSQEDTPATTLIAIMDKLATFRPTSKALFVERPVPEKVAPNVAPSLPIDEWKSWSVGDYLAEGKAAAKGFIHYGLQLWGTVTVFGFNAPEWQMSAVGAVYAGAKIAGIYPSDSRENIFYKLHHSASAVAVIEDEEKLKKVLSNVHDLPDLLLIVTYMCESVDKVIKRPGLPDVHILTWDQLIDTGKQSNLDGELAKRHTHIRPGNACALVYTSGTTGNPKAVMISHDNIYAAATQAIETGLGKSISGVDCLRIISYLPLSHIAGMLVDIWFPIVLGHHYRGEIDCETYFARPYDLKEGTIVNRFATARPSIFLGVPRVWEKIAEKLKALGKANKGLKLTIATWAKSKGLHHGLACQITGDGSYPPMYGIADTVILRMIRQKLGLNDCLYALTGAAPIGKETLEYFASLGIPIMETYGMSESTGSTTFSTGVTNLFGTIGFGPTGFDNAVFHIDEKTGVKKLAPRAKDVFNPTEEEQGEVCFRGRHIMMGYMANMKYGKAHIEEMKKKNSETIDEDGWLHSGDKGTQGENGMFRITGRYKELIITAGGENIAPVPIEDDIKKNCPAISNIMMVGDKMKYNTVLITLKCVGATGELQGTNILDGEAKEVNPKVTTTEEAAKCPIWNKYITDAITATNQNSAVCVSQPSRVQKFTILPRDFSVATEEFTATFKLKRSVVQEMYKAEIATMY